MHFCHRSRSLPGEHDLPSLIRHARQTAQLMPIVLVDPSKFFYDAKDLAQWMAALGNATVLSAGRLRVWIIEQSGPISLSAIHALSYYSECHHL